MSIIRDSPLPYRRFSEGAGYVTLYKDVYAKMMMEYDEDDDYSELYGPKGPSRGFKIHKLFQPEIPDGIPERFEFYGYSHIILNYPIVMPDASGDSRWSMVSMSFIDKLREIGFTEFVTYPVRVHLIETYQQSLWKFDQVNGNIEMTCSSCCNSQAPCCQCTNPFRRANQLIPLGSAEDGQNRFTCGVIFGRLNTP